MEEEVPSVIIDVPKPRIHPTKSVEILTKINLKIKKRQPRKLFSRPSQSSLAKYYLPCDNPLPTKTLNRAEVLLSYKNYLVRQKKYRHLHRLSIDIDDKYKITSTDLRQRLWVENQSDDVLCITNIDEAFFKYVDGRPIPFRTPLNRSLRSLFDEYIRLRHEIGYRNDYILNLDISLQKEQKTYELAVKRVATQAKHFNSFISDDYSKSMLLLDKWEKVKKNVGIKSLEIQNYSMDIFKNTSRLVYLDYRYNLLQRYGRFLYYLSPPSWRTQNRDFAQSVEIEAKGFDYGGSCDADSFTVIFGKMQNECCSQSVSPVIYFKEPIDLARVFENIEKHQLNHFVHVTMTSPFTKMLKKVIKNLKDLIVQDTASVAEFIERFKNVVDFNQERSDQLQEKFFKILNGPFYDSVAKPEVLEFRLHLEFCYKQICFESPIKMDLYSMAKDLESLYLECRNRIDKLQGKNVDRAVKECLEMDKIKLKKTQEAVRELRLFERLKQELLIAYAPPANRVVKFEPQPSTQQNIHTKRITRKSKPEIKRISLTEGEVEYLHLFTDWVETEDPLAYLLSRNLSNAKSNSEID